ncbi:hypothetical protein, partial [Stutzerimonas kirkiae]|uniref:hypothetical protein n=1 Tax=Stutzerimonas kirkiae TaxID=2211392 RepID=UPI001C6FCFE2
MTAKDLAIAHARHQQRLGKAGEPSKTSPIDRGTGLVQANRPADRKSGSQEVRNSHKQDSQAGKL